MSEFEELVQRLSSAVTFLPDKPEETAVSTAKALWLAAMGLPCSVILAQTRQLPGLDVAGRERLQGLIARRLSGVPLAHLTERQSFMGVELLSGPEALIPRKETEIVGHAALAKLKALVSARGYARVIDVCTGSGNLAVVLAVHEPRCEVIGLDLSPDALALAGKNAQLHLIESRVSFLQGDLFVPLEASRYEQYFDLIVCNPPYVSSSRVKELPRETGIHEPHLAFDGGAFGVSIINRVIKESPRLLRPHSWLCFEVGLGQGQYFERSVCKLEEYQSVESFTDDQGNKRALAFMTS